MIDADYNEYKESLEQNMKLVIENHKLKEIIKKVRKALEINIEEHNYEGASISALEILDKEK